MIRMAVCDDEKEGLQWITNIISKWQSLTGEKLSVDTFSKGGELLKALKNDSVIYDMILLDIRLGNMDGVEIARQIRSINEQVLVLFVTNYMDQIFEAFKVNAFRYIMKERLELEFNEVMEDVKQELSKREQYFTYCVKGKIIKLYYHEIIYFESKLKYVEIHLQNETICFRGKLNEVMEELNKGAFVRCHQSFLVNVEQIKGIENNRLLLNTGEALPISNSRKSEVEQAFLWSLK